MIKQKILICGVLLSLLCLLGCGQKGKLYLPDPAAAPAPAPAEE